MSDITFKVEVESSAEGEEIGALEEHIASNVEDLLKQLSENNFQKAQGHFIDLATNVDAIPPRSQSNN